MRELSLFLAAGGLACAWTLLSARLRRRDPNWSPKRDVTTLGITAAITIFIAVPIAPNHPEHARSVGSQIALWLAVWLLLATAIELSMVIRERLLRRRRSV